jgi:hypothetical protein
MTKQRYDTDQGLTLCRKLQSKINEPLNPTPSANYLNNLLNLKNNLDNAADTPHFPPHLFCAIICLDTCRDGYGWAGALRVARNWNGPTGFSHWKCSLDVRTCPVSCQVASTTLWAREPCILDRHSIAFTARTSRRRSARRFLPVAFA